MYQFVSEEEENEKIRNKKKAKHNQYYLLWFYDLNPKPSNHEKRYIASLLDIKYEKINIWFQNERAKRRKAMPIIPYIKFTVVINDKPIEESKILRGSIHKFDYNLSDIQNENRENISPLYQKNNGKLSSKKLDKFEDEHPIDQYDHDSDRISAKYSEHSLNFHTFGSAAEENRFPTSSNSTKRNKPKMKILQIFPTCNSLFVPTKKMRTDGYTTKYTNGDTVTVFGQQYRFKDVSGVN